MSRNGSGYNPGSRQAIIEVLSHRNLWHSLYEPALNSLKFLAMNKFLGAAGYGRVVHVT